MSLWRLPAAADDRHTFFAHALALRAAHGPGPWPGGGYPLPDKEATPVKTDELSARRAGGVIAAIIREQPDIQALQRLHDLLAEYLTAEIADRLAVEVEDLDRERVRQVGRWIAEYGTRRNAVAAGLELVGLTGDGRDRDMLLLLGSLETLSWHAMIALARTQSDRDMAVFELAQRVWSAGRYHTVCHLDQTTDPEIKAWLLREGFRSNTYDQYDLAYIAATTGDLAGALAASDIDEALLDGAGGILYALCNTGPVKDIWDYADAAVVIDRYLKLVRHRPSVPRIRAVLALDRYLHDSRCQELLSDLDWIAAVQQAIEGSDLTKFTEAIWPAKQLRLRLHDHAKAWLENRPYDEYLWCALDDVDDAVVLAERLLPLDELQTGPAGGNGVGVECWADRVLASVVQRVARYPGRGWPLVRTALANRTIVARRAAVCALKAWPRDCLPADALEVVRAAAEAEPDDETRAAMTEIVQVWAGSCSSLTQRA
jgi:hypothetical protein